MHVFFLAHRVPFPADKGEKIRTFHQIKYLVEQGYQVTVFAPLEKRAEQRFATALQARLGVKVFTAPLGSALKRKLTALLTGKAISQSHFFSTELLQQLKQALTQHQPDAIICTSSVMAAYLYRLGITAELVNRSQLLMDFMDLDSDKWQQYARSSSLPLKWVYQREAKLIAQLEQQVQQDFDHCFFISENEVNLFCSKLGTTNNVSVLANGIDTKSFYPATKNKLEPLTAPVFLFTGVMDYWPNEDAVLWFVQKMWGSIKQQWPAASFYIVGMQPSQRIKELAKQPGIIVTGYVDDILPYYHQADIFVGPFRLARGVQNKILQAMACGLPVITTALGAEGIACQPERNIVIANDESAFIAAALRLLASPALCNELGTDAATLIEAHYSWQGVLQKLPALLQKESVSC